MGKQAEPKGTGPLGQQGEKERKIIKGNKKCSFEQKMESYFQEGVGFEKN